MKHVCTNCGTISADSSLWCQNRDCPSGTLSTLFDYGETLGDLQIVRLIRVLRMSAIYEARRGKDTVLLKVAHDGCVDQLKREAAALQQLAEIRQHPMLPTLLRPYPYQNIKQRPYGKTTFQDETKYYLVFQFVEGDFLRDMLIKNPQPWYQHAVWLTVSLADANAFLNVKGGKLLLGLSPDAVLVRMDRDGIPRPLLLDLGLVSEPNDVHYDWIARWGLPAYTAPELLDKGVPVGSATDVYGLGLLLYEMLAGRPAYPFRLESNEAVRNAVRTENPPPLTRTDLSDEVTGIVNQAIGKTPARRQADVVTFARELRSKFGEVPAEKKGYRITRQTVAIAAFAVFAIVVWLIMSNLLT